MLRLAIKSATNCVVCKAEAYHLKILDAQSQGQSVGGSIDLPLRAIRKKSAL